MDDLENKLNKTALYINMVVWLVLIVIIYISHNQKKTKTCECKRDVVQPASDCNKLELTNKSGRDEWKSILYCNGYVSYNGKNWIEIDGRKP